MTDPTPEHGGDERDAVTLERLDTAIDTLTDRIENGPIRDVDYERVRIEQYRTLGYLSRTQGSSLRVPRETPSPTATASLRSSLAGLTYD